VAICLLTLAFRPGRLGFAATAVGALLIAVVAALQWAEFLRSHLLVIGLGTVLPAILLIVAAILQFKGWRSGAKKAA
jgi:hypothetical protein